MFYHINLLDTSVSTDNLGDLIIADSIQKELRFLLEKVYVTNTTTHDSIGSIARKKLSKSNISLLLGTNVLSSKYKFFKRDMWDLSGKDIKALENKVVLCGVGWRKYRKHFDWLQKRRYQKVLSSDFLHSVRDRYSFERLEECGVKNVINTSCPTLWSLTPERVKLLPENKSEKVVFTVTRHKKSPGDIKMVETILKNYEEVYFWPQQITDLDYLKKIKPDISGLKIVPPSLMAYDKFLEENDVDYVGNRLHGGIRALQKGKRSIIIAIDNRAKEISKDIKLPVINRDDISDLQEMINSKINYELKLPHEEIQKWKDQFLKLIKGWNN